jgi:hypothetical protein
MKGKDIPQDRLSRASYENEISIYVLQIAVDQHTITMDPEYGIWIFQPFI